MLPGQRASWCPRSGYWLIFIGTVCKSSAYDGTLKIEVILSLLQDAQTQTRWNSFIMLQGQNCVPANKTFSQKTGMSLVENCCWKCSHTMSSIDVPALCPHFMFPLYVPALCPRLSWLELLRRLQNLCSTSVRLDLVVLSSKQCFPVKHRRNSGEREGEDTGGEEGGEYLRLCRVTSPLFIIITGNKNQTIILTIKCIQ